MTANELRQSFLDFFQGKEHSIVPSASLMPTSPNLQFTNAGMNQFVPYFLGAEKAPYDPARAADTQKCIRAGGKHNDLDDVGYDTYHHTFFEMLGNWSFGDYFKREAIEWSWELVVDQWGFPPERLYATVYAPQDGDPSEFDQEAYDYWEALFTRSGLDPKVHIVDGNAKDNFWAMGDTGPCGPCSELHVDLTPQGDTGGSLVNGDDARCIEIWNLVFIQYNRNEDGSYRPLPAKHVDTGMGFERACSIYQCTDGFQDFSSLASNYDTDVFSPLFAKIAELSGKDYQGTVPEKRSGLTEQEQIDVAFRVIADHVRTVSFSIADGILPGNNGRNSTVKAILRRAVRFGREIGLGGAEPFLPKLVPTLVDQLGDAFPELKERSAKILKEVTADEMQFNKTLDRGLRLFAQESKEAGQGKFAPESVVKLWETYGFPLELTKVLLEEQDLATDWKRVDELVEIHKASGKRGETSQVVSALELKTEVVSEFCGFEVDETEAEVVEVMSAEEMTLVIVDRSPLYVEKGGQLGDTGLLFFGEEEFPIRKTIRAGEALCLQIEGEVAFDPGTKVRIALDGDRRRSIEANHTVTHLLHWALHEVVDQEASQQGSLVAPERLRFDFNSGALDEKQLEALTKQVNERISANDEVSWQEVDHADIKEREDILQFFGDKYGDRVRVVQIGGKALALDGYSMELCGGTHVRSTAEIGLFAIKSEGAIAAGTRRIEAVSGEEARRYLSGEESRLEAEARQWHAELADVYEQLEENAPQTEPWSSFSWGELRAGDMGSALSHLREARETVAAAKNSLVKAKKSLQKKEAKAHAEQAESLLAEKITAAQEGSEGGVPFLVVSLGTGDASLIQEGINAVKKRAFPGVAVLASEDGEKVFLGVQVDGSCTGYLKAGDLMRELAPIVGGKGGGKPDQARGAGTEVEKLPELLQEAEKRLKEVVVS
ncbi:MAG: alanine--tRNA ligase [Verrucomicrobiota bacterium]